MTEDDHTSENKCHEFSALFLLAMITHVIAEAQILFNYVKMDMHTPHDNWDFTVRRRGGYYLHDECG